MSTADFLDRRALLAPVTGTVLEIGPGRGVNLPYYRPDVTWTGLEPSRRKHASIRAVARRTQRAITVHEGVAEAIPLPEASVDAVVSTFVLCSVADPDLALTEIRRVLRPDGSFVFLEHVAPPQGTASRRITDAWARLHIGQCRPNRDTVDTLGRAGFADLRLTETVARPLGFTIPIIRGTATQ